MGGTILGNHKLPTQEFFTGETPLIKMYEKDGDTNQPLDLTGATSTLRLCYFEDKSFVVMMKVGIIREPILGNKTVTTNLNKTIQMYSEV